MGDADPVGGRASKSLSANRIGAVSVHALKTAQPETER